MKAQSPNALTLLTARSKLLAKIVRPEGNQLKAEGKLLLPYRVDAETVPVDSLETLGSLLSSLASEPHRCIIRGALNGGRSSASAIRRLAYDDEKTGDKAQFEPVARAWVSFDLDDFPLGSVDPFDLEAVAALSRSLLPVEFHGAACAVQITTGHTIKPGNMGRVRPWFMLDRGVTEDELKRWFAGKLTGKQGGFIDASVWRTVQPNFTAAPVFEGCSDPLSARVVMLDGEAVASVPELPEPVEVRPMPRAGGGGRITGAVDPVALDDAKPVPIDDLRAFIARQCRKVSSLSSGRHEQLLATGRTLGGVLHYGAVPRHEIEAALFAAVEVSGYCTAYGEASARRAIASSLNNGAAAPIDLHKLLNLDRLKGSSIGSEAPRIEVDFLPVVEASARVMGSVEALFSDARCWHNRREGLEDKAAPAHVLKATAALGKSRAVRDAIGAELARGIPEDKAVYIFVPTHDLADEAQRAFALEYPLWPSMVFRGRSAKDPAGFALNPDAPATMCLQPDLTKEVSATGLSVRPHLCEGKGVAAWCRSGCRYLAQSEQGARVVFLSHQYLKHGIPEGMPPAWAVVIDENFERVGSTRITSEMLNETPAFDFEDDDDAEALGVISKRMQRAGGFASYAMIGGESIGSALKAAGFTVDDARNFAKLEQRAADEYGRSDIDPTMTEDSIWAILEARKVNPARHSRERARFWRMAAAAWVEGGGQRIVVRSEDDKEGGKRRVVRLFHRPVLRVKAPMLLIDADACPVVTAATYPGRAFSRVDVRLRARVTQITDSAVSKHKLLRADGCEGRRRTFGLMVSREVARAGVGKVLAVASKGVAFALLRDEQPGISTDEIEAAAKGGGLQYRGAHLAWFGPSTRGVDRWKDCETVVVLGSRTPPVGKIEDDARSLFGDDPDPLELLGSEAMFPTRQEGIATRSGKRVSVDVRHHPDARADALLRQFREQSTIQAIARIRAVHCAAEKRIVILSNIPLEGVEVDVLTTWQDFAPDRMQAAILERLEACARRGVPFGLRLSGGGLSADAPGEFPTQKTAEGWFGRGGVNTPVSIIDTITGTGVLTATGTGVLTRICEVKLRLQGQRGPKATPAIIVCDPSDAKASAAKIWGPVASCEVVAVHGGDLWHDAAVIEDRDGSGWQAALGILHCNFDKRGAI